MTIIHHDQKDCEVVPCDIHHALIRPILLAGADRTLVMLNLTCIVTLIFGVGLHILTIGLALLLGSLGHGILRRLATYDAQFSAVYIRHIRYKDVYLAQSYHGAPFRKTYPTL